MVEQSKIISMYKIEESRTIMILIYHENSRKT